MNEMYLKIILFIKYTLYFMLILFSGSSEALYASKDFEKDSYYYTGSRNIEATTFVENLAKEVFSDCAIALLYNGDLSSPDISRINSILSTSFLELSKEVHSLGKNKTNSPYGLKNYVKSKFLGRCRLVITLTMVVDQKKCEKRKSLSPAFTNDLVEKLSLHPESDFYIFLTNLYPESNCGLLYGTFSEKLKYKLIIYDELVLPNTSKAECKVKGAHVKLFNSESSVVQLSSADLDKICYKLNKRSETVSLDAVFPDFTRNFYGHTMRISVPTKISGYLQLGKQNDGSWFAKRGKEMYLLEAVRTKLNFTVNLFPSTGINNDSSTYGSSGAQLPNGEWTGCVGDLLNDRADFSTTSGPSVGRILIVDFSTFFGGSTLTFITGKPKVFFSWTAIFQVFRIKLWIALFFVCAFVVVYFLLLNKCSMSIIRMKYLNSNKAIDEKHFQVWSTKKTMHYLFATLLGQDIPFPKLTPTRVFFVFWLFFSMVISTVYVSKLVTYLAFPEQEKIPLTFTELVNSGYKWGLHGGCRRGIGEYYIKNSVSPTYVKLYKRMELDPGDENCLSNCLASNYACIVFKAISDFMIQRSYIDSIGQHDFAYASDSSSLFVVCGWMMKKGNVYKESIDRILQIARDSGLVDKWEKIDHSLLRMARTSGSKNEHYKNKPPQVTNTSLSLKNFTAALVVIAVGCIMSTATFVAEKIYKRFKN